MFDTRLLTPSQAWAAARSQESLGARARVEEATRIVEQLGKPGK